MVKAVMSDWLSASMLHNRDVILNADVPTRAAIALGTTAAYPLLLMPMGALLLRRRRDVNTKESAFESAVLRPALPQFWFHAAKALACVAVCMFHVPMWLARAPNIKWRSDEATWLNTLLFVPAAVVLFDLTAYVGHRAMHTRLLYKLSRHDLHHANRTPCSMWDGMYTATFEMMYILVVTWLPCFVLPCHVLAIFFYVYPVAFLVAVVDHSGRDFTVTLPELPSLGLPRIVLYDSKRHDDHHRLRKGNYATIVFQIDTLFGTEINRKRPPTHAQQLWAHAAVKVRVVGRFGVLYLRLKDNLSELSERSGLSDLSERSGVAELSERLSRRVSYYLEDPEPDGEEYVKVD